MNGRTYLSGILLGGLAIECTVGWWWADPVATDDGSDHKRSFLGYPSSGERPARDSQTTGTYQVFQEDYIFSLVRVEIG
jgi:hypothetical protein